MTADLYQVIGLSLYRNSEYTKSLVYCSEALKLYDRYGYGQQRLEAACYQYDVTVVQAP